MKLSKTIKIFALAAISFGSASAQNYQIPRNHHQQHAEQNLAQNKSAYKSGTTSSNEEIQDYFYPFAKFSYIVTPDAEKPNLAVTYSMSKGNILTQKTERFNGNSMSKISEEAYKLSFDGSRQAIVSTEQIIQNMMGTRRASDKITMFLLPKDSKPVNWTESVKGDVVNCSAKYVYITFTFEGKKLYRKAVKIERTTPLDKSSSVKEWSYWVKGLSRLATYGYWGDPKKINCIEKSVNISLEDPVAEISKAEYDRKH